MNVDERGRTAAESLRTATTVSVDTGLAQLRRTRRRRDAGRVVAVCAMAMACVGGTFLALDRGDDKAAPAEEPGPRNGPIIDSGERDFVLVPTLPSEPPYPLWQGVDPDSGSFLYAIDNAPIAIVDKSGAVAKVDCPGICTPGPYPGAMAFGPGEDEITFQTRKAFGAPQQSLSVYGYDSELREEIDLPDAVLPARSFDLITWSPDGRELAVALDSPYKSRTGEVWIIARDGSDARLIHREQAPRQLVDGRYVNTPLVVDLAWSPDGDRVGILVAHEYQPREQQSTEDPSQPLPRLITVPARGGPELTLHTFGPTGANTVSTNYIRDIAFAWSPDGTRIAVTDSGRVAEISATDGTVLAEHPGSTQGPLAWLPR